MRAVRRQWGPSKWKYWNGKKLLIDFFLRLSFEISFVNLNNSINDVDKRIRRVADTFW